MRSKLVFLGVGFVCALVVACDVIIGLDKVKKCDGNELVCEPLDASDAGVDASDTGTVSDAFSLPDGVSEASSWPQWRMDNTASEVNKGAADASLANFQNDAGLIVDVVSGGKLAWHPQLGAAVTIDQAVAFCASLKARLPTRIEIATLLDSTRGGPPYIAKAFDVVLSPDGGPVGSPFLWTASFNRPIDQPLHYWLADLGNGDMIQQAPFGAMGVLCVQ